jgi:gas vesicle protein
MSNETEQKKHEAAMRSRTIGIVIGTVIGCISVVSIDVAGGYHATCHLIVGVFVGIVFSVTGLIIANADARKSRSIKSKAIRT